MKKTASFIPHENSVDSPDDFVPWGCIIFPAIILLVVVFVIAV